MIDFGELDVAGLLPGTRLEQLTRAILVRLDCEVIQWSGVGPDEGKDLIISERLEGRFSSRRMRWLVSCKHRPNPRSALKLKELDDSINPALRHNCEGFLLVTTLIATDDLLRFMYSIKFENDHIKLDTRIWDYAELESILTRPDFADIFRSYLPDSFERYNFGHKIGASLRILKANLGRSDHRFVDRIEKLIDDTRNLLLESTANDSNDSDVHSVGKAMEELLDEGNGELAARYLLQASSNARLRTIDSLRRHLPQHYPALTAAVYALGRFTSVADELFDLEAKLLGDEVASDFDKIQYISVEKAQLLLEKMVSDYLSGSGKWTSLRTVERLKLVSTPDQLSVDDVMITRSPVGGSLRERIAFRADLTLTLSTHHVEGDHPETISGWCEGRIVDGEVTVEVDRFDAAGLVASDD